MDNISYDKAKLIAGIAKVANAVKVTIGSAGTNAILEEELQPYHIVTNDGISIASKIKLTDPVENIGANIMKEVAIKANRESGDGTTTTMILTHAILEEAMKSESIGALLQEIYKEVGKDGIIELDNSNTSDSYHVITEGVRLRNCGFMYPYMTNDPKGTKATHLVPKILITKQKISTLQEIDHLFGSLSKQGITELVIFCDEIDPIVSTTLAQTQMQGLFRTLVIKAPVLWKDWLYEDFAKITGATIVDIQSGLKLKNVRIDHLGTCDKLITTKDETIVLGIHDISTHVKALEEQDTDDARLRLAWLKTKTAIFKLGANSESELSYLRLKTEDARNASYLALKGGVVAGGGVALLNCIKDLPDTIGGKILDIALQTPMKQIVSNAGMVKFVVLSNGTRGFDSKRLKLVDMFEAGIVDPTIVVKNSIKNAISVAGTVLTANVVIFKSNETKG